MPETMTFTCSECRKKHIEHFDRDHFVPGVIDTEIRTKLINDDLSTLGWQEIDGELFCDLCSPGEEEKAGNERGDYEDQVKLERSGYGRV